MWFLAKVDVSDPAFLGVLMAWVLAVTLHEFAHGIVAYWGGDYTIRERGGLSLNPLQYVDPLMSIILPVIFLLIGGIPLPGGATFVRRDLLRSKGWDSAVSAAGPLMNFILFLLLAIPLLPAVGWIDPSLEPRDWTTAQRFVGAMCFLQLLSVLLNLVPVPPLDGFGIIAPHLEPELRTKLTTPPTSTWLFMGYFMLMFAAPGFWNMIIAIMEIIMGDTLAGRSWGGYESIFHQR